MLKTVCLTSLVLVSGLAAAEISEKIAKRLESSEAAYQAAVQKADNARFYAIQKASQDRVKALKAALTEATKAGDFDSANELKSQLAAAEAAGGVKARPKETVKFGGHEYALIEEKATWHVAKRRCEEMGGHLAILELPAEMEFVKSLCLVSGTWVGATDESVEGQWRWINGARVPEVIVESWALDNGDEAQHSLAFWVPSGRWEDGFSGHRYAFICEWE